MSDVVEPMPAPLAKSGGELLVECLLAYHPALWTCVPGESFLPLLDALSTASQRGTATLVTTRHEAAAGNMAEAAGKLTGRPSVCVVTRGPGAMHASIAVHTAYQDGTPMILIIGQVARRHLGREAFQEMDYRAVFGSFTKDVVVILDADRIPEHVAAAMYTSSSGRPGPVVLVVPEDMLADTTSAIPSTSPIQAPLTIDSTEVDRITAELTKARRPCLVVGGPGWTSQAGANLQKFAEVNNIPVVTAFRWQDTFDNLSPSYAGYLGLGCSRELRKLLRSTDLVVALGPRLDDPTTDGYEFPSPGTRLITVTRSASDLAMFPQPDVAVIAEPADVCEHLSSVVLAEQPEREDWFNTLRDQQSTFSDPAYCSERPPTGVDLAEVVQHVRSRVPRDTVITNGAGNYTVWVQRFFAFQEFGTQLAPRNGAMGYGLPAGLAAARLNPDRLVVTFAGDGCFMMSGSELATAIQSDLRLIVIVVNNSMFGTIRMHQERQFPGRPIATRLTNPDFAQYAESFGALGIRVTDTDDFSDAFTQALAHPTTSVIEIVTDPAQLTPDHRLG